MNEIKILQIWFKQVVIFLVYHLFEGNFNFFNDNLQEFTRFPTFLSSK
jgi:hypothetical protein